MQVQVRTTQNVFIHYPVASVGDRILAYLLDQLILVVFVLSTVALYLSLKMETHLGMDHDTGNAHTALSFDV